MMKRESTYQPKLFYSNFSIEERIPKNYILRRIQKAIDFEFAYAEVEDTYGYNGNPSVPPPVILKLMLLLVLYNVRSERELLQSLPFRLDWLWFLGFDIDTPIPNHRVLSKARTRWGLAVFESFFVRIVWPCVAAGLVDGDKIFVDASFVEADASMNSLVDAGSRKHRLHQSYPEFERRLDETPDEPQRGYQKVNRRRVSTTDPDAAIGRDGKVQLGYLLHRAVDEAHEVVTATRTTPADANEAHLLTTLLDDDQPATHRTAQTAVADSRYGTVENLLACHDQGVTAHMPDLGQSAQKRNAQRGVFGEERFRYDAARDVLICPQGHELTRHGFDSTNTSIYYGARRKVCAACALRPRCTRNKAGRRVRRHRRQADLDRMHCKSRGAASKRDIRKRQHLMERSFAQSKPYGYDRARWRGLWRVQMQQLLLSAVHNLRILLQKGSRGPEAVATSSARPGGGTHFPLTGLLQRITGRPWTFGRLLGKFCRIHGVPNPAQ